MATKVIVYSISATAEIITATDTVTHDEFVNLRDSIGLTDYLDKKISKSYSIYVQDSIAVSDIATIDFSASIEDNVVLRDETDLEAISYIDITDDIIVSDTAALGHVRNFDNYVSITDEVDVKIGRDLEDRVQVSDSLNIALDVVITDPVVVSEDLGNESSMQFSDFIDVDDGLDIATGFGLEFVDSINLYDSTHIDFHKELYDPITVTDFLRAGDIDDISEFTKEYNEFISVTDDLVISQNHDRSVIDDITFSDSLHIVADSSINRVDTIRISDTLTRVVVANIELTDSVDVLDDLETVADSGIEFVDDIIVSDNLDIVPEIVIELADNVGVSDGLEIVANSNVEITDNVGVSDALDIRSDSGMEFVDNIYVSDKLDISTEYKVNLIDRILLYEEIVKGKVLAFYEFINLHSGLHIGEVKSGTLKVSDQISIYDTLAITGVSRDEFADNLPISDTLYIQTEDRFVQDDFRYEKNDYSSVLGNEVVGASSISSAGYTIATTLDRTSILGEAQRVNQMVINSSFITYPNV